MTRSSSSCFLSFLLTAGVLGICALRASAGDKIQFSPSSDPLAKPAEQQMDETPMDSRLAMPSRGLDVPMGYFPQPTIVVTPARRTDSRDRDSRDSASDPYGNDSQGRGFDNRTDQQNGDMSSAYAVTNKSPSLEGAWDPSSASLLSRDSQNLDLHYGSLNARQEAQRRLDYGDGSGSQRSSDPYSANGLGSQKSSLSELLRQQSESGSQSGLYKQDSAMSRLAQIYGFSQSPSTSPVVAPPSATGFSQDATSGFGSTVSSSASSDLSAYDKTPDRNPQTSYDLSGLHAWDAPSASPSSQPYAKPSTAAASPMVAPGQNHPATLSFPKRLGSVFNN